MTFLKKYWWLVAVVVYVVIGVIVGATVAERPVLGGLLWPFALLKHLLRG